MKRRRTDTGDGAVSYLAVALIISGVAAAMVSTDVPGAISENVKSAVCRVTDENGCGRPAAQGTEPEPASTGEGERLQGLNAPAPGNGNGSLRPDGRYERPTNPDVPPERPSREQSDRALDALQTLEDNLKDHGDGCGTWYNPTSWGLFGCEEPKDTLDNLSPQELNALLDLLPQNLDDPEIRELMNKEGVRDIFLHRADSYELNMMESEVRGSIGPNYDPEQTGSPLPAEARPSGWTSIWQQEQGEYNTVRRARLFAPGDEVSQDDIHPEDVARSRWMASVQRVASTPEGRTRIHAMIKQNENLTATVTFPDGHKETVTPYFPFSRGGYEQNPRWDNLDDLAYARPRHDPNADPVIWPLILEKAAAQRYGGYAKINAHELG